MASYNFDNINKNNLQDMYLIKQKKKRKCNNHNNNNKS